MTRKYWLGLVPSLSAAAGVIVASLVTVRIGHSGRLVMAGPVLLALTILAASALESRLRGASWTPSRAALILAGSCILAAALVGPSNPSMVRSLTPVLAATGWVALLARPQSDRSPCRAV